MCILIGKPLKLVNINGNVYSILGSLFEKLVFHCFIAKNIYFPVMNNIELNQVQYYS